MLQPPAPTQGPAGLYGPPNFCGGP